jgi:hypothetical protein
MARKLVPAKAATGHPGDTAQSMEKDCDTLNDSIQFVSAYGQTGHCRPARRTTGFCLGFWDARRTLTWG